ncbi:hypothetical protein PsorP6_000475 [Peronosclerospora sorghi]|uniref:Uncharacterized protein n=1 Tax=Peronosclerospora sorghi TaxID=230839 RepID=A0ACC0WQW4_9STRA|nr:hypothetical protein PsorP6_000475 [Peronosclerospora sorghi]
MGRQEPCKTVWKSERSPDDRSQQQIARIMSRFGGKFQEHTHYYPDDTMNDAVYAVNGGMENWGYAASWEKDVSSRKPIQPCKPQTYGGYPARKTMFFAPIYDCLIQKLYGEDMYVHYFRFPCTQCIFVYGLVVLLDDHLHLQLTTQWSR